LVPEVTLDRVLPLTRRTICLVFPYTTAGKKRLSNGPRLSKLLEQVFANNGKFIIGQLDEVDLDLLPPTTNKTVIDLSSENLILVARELAHSLSQAIRTGGE
jgi:hypothetical protein